VATACATGLTADCTGLAMDMERRLLLQTRPAFGGNIMATIVCPQARPQMATVRPRVMKKGERREGFGGQLVKVPVAAGLASATQVMEVVADLSEKVNLTGAEVVVVGGRGLGKPEGFDLVRELATALGGVVGATRGAVDLGWIGHAHQVGQTGRTVGPKLYVGVGVSGAVQHLVGMQSSETIVAINSDPHAPIFQVATYGIVGDLYEVVPSMLERLRELRG
jgi:electron transfer flavoprotein alpha subunit